MTPKLLSGPSLPPLQGGAPQKLVVLLHGYGSSGDDLIALGAQWRGLLPQAEFIAPHAPEPYEPMSSMGYQWFGLEDFDPENIDSAAMRRGVEHAAPFLQRFLEESLESRGLKPADLALVGFSQGTMMALSVLEFLPSVKAIVGYSGAFYPSPTASPAAPSTKVLLIHGEADEIVPFKALTKAVEDLAQEGVEAETYLRPRLGHSIDFEGLQKGGQFLQKHLEKNAKEGKEKGS